MTIETEAERDAALLRAMRLKEYLASLPPTEDAWEKHCRWATQATVFNLEEDIEEFEYHARQKREKLPLTSGS
ncbi:hypothetical protein [Armatimonas rosea]|uniref:Formylglycine-generating enzyme required for sulfatase activity n=1 Tax=Armatimonas rosea TaxID=685828 RepID=A0A7W9SSB9_ARMRO|nr:hypothetical protein [Armatimonas rosea]MBB6051941.1 formylglycine-generating enzyme required for sulfatase activity [Armatimonas rosea]